jgi:hypothetical protein
MYKDCKVQVKIVKEARYIYYNTGAQQGDNAAPILFIAVMIAVSLTLKTNGHSTHLNMGTSHRPVGEKAED